MKTKRSVWRSGPPPEIGWWPASFCKNKEAIRWFDGSRWSAVARLGFTAEEAAVSARLDAVKQDCIQWTDRWWV